jgi:hypothetical protein
MCCLRDEHYRRAKAVVDEIAPGKFSGTIVAFGEDEEHPPLQIADLFAYEWRKRISDKVKTPSKPERKSYRRIRSERSANAKLHHYDADAMRALRSSLASKTFVTTFLNYPTTED